MRLVSSFLSRSLVLQDVLVLCVYEESIFYANNFCDLQEGKRVFDACKRVFDACLIVESFSLRASLSKNEYSAEHTLGKADSLGIYSTPATGTNSLQSLNCSSHLLIPKLVLSKS